MAKQLNSYCIGHVPPLFTPGAPYQMLCPSPLGLPGELVIEDNRFGPGVDGTSLAEYSQLFGLYELLSAGDVVADKLYLFQYRKFLSPRQGGLESVSPWVRVAFPPEAAALFPDQDTLESLSARIVVGSMFELGESIPSNYARVHVVDDLVMFVAALAKNSYLSEGDIRSFATFRGIIPSPALCYLNVEVFMKVMAVLREAWNDFYPHYHVRREGYQRRVAGYLLERLHSYLLCKWLLDGTEPDVGIWGRYVVTEQMEVQGQ